MKSQDIDLSVIIPCYNEENILVRNIEKIKGVLERTQLTYEIILVDDLSKDRTLELASMITKESDNIRLIRHASNMGRGKAVEDGLIAARGRIVGFLDIDLQVPAHYILPLVIEIENGADIATAQRIYDMKLHMLYRFILSKGYHLVFDILLKTGIKDSETGFKFFNRGKILLLLNEIKDKHWFWDTEIMVRAFLKGYVIREVPCLRIREESQKTTVKIFRDALRHIVNLLRFKKEVDSIRKKRK